MSVRVCAWMCIFYSFVDEGASCLLPHHFSCQNSMQQPPHFTHVLPLLLIPHPLPLPPPSPSSSSISLQRGPTWVLFNLAGLYWRIVGNPRQAIECHRRAIHMCPRIHRDVGFVGLSNTLRRLGKLDDAVKTTRAALDVNFDEVGVCVHGV